MLFGKRALRQRVSRALAGRDILDVSQWHAIFGAQLGVTEPAVRLVLEQLEQHTGVSLGSARPDDQLESLELSRLSHGDWDLDLWESFRDRFGFEPDFRLGGGKVNTLGELMLLVQDALSAPK